MTPRQVHFCGGDARFVRAMRGWIEQASPAKKMRFWIGVLSTTRYCSAGASGARAVRADSDLQG
jgi:hypothetical protein